MVIRFDNSKIIVQIHTFYSLDYKDTMGYKNGEYLLVAISVCFCMIFNSASATLPNKPYRRAFINPYPRFKAYHDGGNPGEPLFLTPMIEANNITEARDAARVVGSQFHNVTSYAGYLTVDKQYNSNLFFWYFPAEFNQPYAPVVLWLQGGPGASSMFGLFQENGPFEFKKAKHPERRQKYSWSEKMNLIYIDNPVGTGFSFTDSFDGYSTNERQVGKNLYQAVRQLFKLFDFQSTDGFWITGESYAGKYIPALAYYTHHAQNSVDNDVFINLKGVAIGNGLSDPQHQLNYGDYLYQLGLIDLNSYKKFQILEQEAVDLIHEHKLGHAFEIFDSLMNIDGNFNGSLFKNLTGYSTYFNYLNTSAFDEGQVHAMGNFLQSSEVRRAIHVGNQTFHDLDDENKVEEHLKKDVMDSVAPWVADILNYYTVCIYNGQLDIIVAYPLTVNYLQNLKFSSADIYKIAKREIWKVDSEIAGYKKRAGNLLEVLVRNAGHMVPRDQPKWMFDLITDLTGTRN